MFLKLIMVVVFILMPFIFLFAQDKSEDSTGGALHFNYNLSSWEEGHKKQIGDFGSEVFRVNAKAKYKEKNQARLGSVLGNARSNGSVGADWEIHFNINTGYYS